MCWLAATMSLKVSAILPTRPVASRRHAHREVAHPHRLQGAQKVLELASLSGAIGERSGVILDGYICGFAHAHVTPSVSPRRGRIPTGIRKGDSCLRCYMTTEATRPLRHSAPASQSPFA